ncbi:MAG: lipoprotein [Pseudomonadota bacterium]
MGHQKVEEHHLTFPRAAAQAREMSHISSFFVLFACLALGLTACGRKAPLDIPPPPPAQEDESAPDPEE